MKEKEFKAILYRKINNKYTIIDTKDIYGYDDENLIQNLYGEALSEFKDIIQVNDVISLGFEYSWGQGSYGYFKYNSDGTTTQI